jgi:ubiquinone/menaquinone biosynthesis C-methylase UbiE
VSEQAAVSHYIHGTDPGERERLGLLNDMLNRKCLVELAPRPGDRVLDAGSGLGQFTHAIAGAVGSNGRVVGIERSLEQLTHARAITPALAEFREGDAYRLPLREDEWGSFDVIHARFLLEHLQDPLEAVRQMVRAVRPGGRIVLEDDDHPILKLEPEPPGFPAVWTAYQRAYDRLGNDPMTGRRLVSILYQAGARPSRATLISWSNCTGSEEFPVLVRNLIEVIRTARPQVVRFNLLSGAAFDSALAEIARWSQRPDAAFWYAVSWAEGIIPL